MPISIDRTIRAQVYMGKAQKLRRALETVSREPIQHKLLALLTKFTDSAGKRVFGLIGRAKIDEIKPENLENILRRFGISLGEADQALQALPDALEELSTHQLIENSAERELTSDLDFALYVRQRQKGIAGARFISMGPPPEIISVSPAPPKNEEILPRNPEEIITDMVNVIRSGTGEWRSLIDELKVNVREGKILELLQNMQELDGLPKDFLTEAVKVLGEVGGTTSVDFLFNIGKRNNAFRLLAQIGLIRMSQRQDPDLSQYIKTKVLGILSMSNDYFIVLLSVNLFSPFGMAGLERSLLQLLNWGRLIKRFGWEDNQNNYNRYLKLKCDIAKALARTGSPKTTKMARSLYGDFKSRKIGPNTKKIIYFTLFDVAMTYPKATKYARKAKSYVTAGKMNLLESDEAEE